MNTNPDHNATASDTAHSRQTDRALIILAGQRGGLSIMQPIDICLVIA